MDISNEEFTHVLTELHRIIADPEETPGRIRKAQKAVRDLTRGSYEGTLGLPLGNARGGQFMRTTIEYHGDRAR